MHRYFLGADIGGTKTHVLIADETGRALSLGSGGPGNHESVGYEGTRRSLQAAFDQAMQAAGLRPEQISGAGFGVAGYDWPCELQPLLDIIASLKLRARPEVVNDTILGLLAGSDDGWGVAVVSGTGCNCRGWDQQRLRQGRITGGGVMMAEGAGASELIFRAVQSVAHEWTRRGPKTALSKLFVDYTGASDLEDLLEGLMGDRLQISADAAPLVFQAARQGDAVAAGLVEWAGMELGEMVKAVVRQLAFETLAFDVVMVGGMFAGGPALVDAMHRTIQALAPGARLVRLAAPVVIGAVLLGMEQTGQHPQSLPYGLLRRRLSETVAQTPAGQVQVEA